MSSREKASKIEQKKLSKIIVLISLLTDEIDDPNITANETLKDVSKAAESLKDLLEPILDKVYGYGYVSSSTFINDMASKFEYNFKKLYKV